MKTRLLAMASIALAASLSGCAHQNAGYAYGGGYAMEECEFGQDCYGGYQYTCVFVPNGAPARMEVNPVRHSHSPRTLDPRFDATNSGSSSSSASASAPATTMSREPVVVAAPAVDRGTTRTRN
jgi:hypothetical protein